MTRQSALGFLAGVALASYAIIVGFAAYQVRVELREARQDLAIIHNDITALTGELREMNNELVTFSMSVQQNFDRMSKENKLRGTY